MEQNQAGELPVERELQLILRNAILHQADTETLCHVFGLDKEFK